MPPRASAPARTAEPASAAEHSPHPFTLLRDEVVAERVHEQLRRHARLVAKVVAVLAGRERRASLRLDRDQTRVALAFELAAVVRERDAREVASAAHAADDDVGLVLGELHLSDALLADDRLVQTHMVEHRAE